VEIITHGEILYWHLLQPVNKKIRAPLEDAFVFADLVQPILEKNVSPAITVVRQKEN